MCCQSEHGESKQSTVFFPEPERQRVQGGKNAWDLQVSNGEEGEAAPPLLLDGATSPLGPKRFPESLAKH